MNEKYIPLYRKYRPQRLEEIVGQEHIKKALTNAITMNKISHAYLFTGPRGTGKTSTARILAKSLNCKEGPTVNPCGVCENCLDITNSVPMDVIEIDAASNRKVEDAQNILEKVMYAPVNSRYKIYIIDEVHMLSNTAFNALLKTLEEPPKNVIFILATTEVHKVLDTIKSRCQRFDFRRITTDDIVKHLRFISDKEGINITDDALFTIAKNSAGGMRDSIALLDQLSILDGEEAISTDDINNLLGRISFDTLHGLADEVINSNPQGAIEVLEKIYNSGNEPSQILTNLLDYFKNLLIVKNCNPSIIFELTQLNEPQIKELTVQTEKLETHQITFLIDKTSNYIKEVKTTNNPRLWLEVGIIDLANLTENTSLLELQNRITKLESGIQVQSTPVKIFKAPPAPAVGPKPSVLPHKEETVQSNSPVSSVPPTTRSGQTVGPEINSASKSEGVTPAPSQTPVHTHSNVSGTQDNAVLWGNLLNNVSSAPTRALLKQWANPIKISPEETILTIKNEILMSQFISGNKKKILTDAVDALFAQSDSNIIVRLPKPDDVQIKPSSQTSSPRHINAYTPPKETAPPENFPKHNKPTASQETVSQNSSDETLDEEIVEETKGTPSQDDSDADKVEYAVSHSDQVSMIMDLFDGKII